METFTGRDSDKKPDKDTMAAIADPYREKNEFEFVDGIGKMYEKIQELESRIDGFKSNVDTALTIVNATTFIEIDF